MSYDNPQSILKNLQEFSGEYEKKKYSHQIHERSILYELEHAIKKWPKFSEDLDIRLYYSTHYQIWEGLQLLKFKGYEKNAKKYIKEGAQSLEYLYNSNPNIPYEIRIEILFKSMLAYYISGNHACAYVLSEDLKNYSELPPLLNLIFNIMNKNLKNTRLIISQVFSDEKFKEDKILEEEVDIDEKLSRVIYYSTVKATSYYLEFLKSGEQKLFKNALSLINTCVELSKDLNYVDYWWWLYCLSFILVENYEKSLWNHLILFDNKLLIKKYIKSYLANEHPITELWPSQVESIQLINDENRRSYCLKMPTSAGKTLIAELNILRFFLDFPDSDKKCIYIAPYNALAAEVEQTLNQGLRPVGLKVSEFYGYYESNPVEELLVQESDILVITPEKFDAIFRYEHLLPENIGLIIIDEGHLICSDKENFLKRKKSRNIRFEFLLHRLLNKIENCRFVFISAVLPNARDVARWISGSSNQLLEKNWRPTRLMVGNLIWNGKEVKIEYNQLNQKTLKENICINNFISTIDLTPLKSTKKRSNFPNDANHALALSALKFARNSTTLVYAPQKKQVKSFAKTLLKVIKLQNDIAKESNQEILNLKVNEEHEFLVNECKEIIKSEMGDDTPLIEYLDNGFLMHHSDLPKLVKTALENLIKKNVIQLIIATTTIANGVNLPIKTVLIKGLYQGHNDTLDHMQFWNICGRAGRAGIENEGQALFLIDETEIINAKPKKRRVAHIKHRKKLNIIKNITHSVNDTIFASTLYILLNEIIIIWKKNHHNPDLSKLYDLLAENHIEWALNDQENLVFWIEKLDTYLLALSEESEKEIIEHSDLQKIVEGSLSSIIIEDKTEANNFVNITSMQEILNSRLKYIYNKFPSSNVRKQAYNLGLSISTFELIQENIAELDDIIYRGHSWDIFYINEKIQYLIDISTFVLKMKEVFENYDIYDPEIWVHDQWEIILKSWLKGYNTAQMIDKIDITLNNENRTDLKIFIEKFCGKILPWGLNSLLNFIKIYYHGLNEEIPVISSYIPHMVKYGTIEPEVICLLPYNLERNECLLLASICPFNYYDPEKIADWVKKLTLKKLLHENIDMKTALNILNTLEKHINREKISYTHIINFELENKLVELQEGERVLLISDSETPEYMKLFTLDGKFMASKFLKEEFPEWILNSNVVDYFIKDIKQIDGIYSFNLVIER